MYPKGLRELVQGFTKNFASGAMRIPWPVLLLVILWITALARTAIELGSWMFAPTSGSGLIFLALYAGLGTQLCWKARQIGNFSVITCVLYPVPLLFSIFVVLYSLYRKVFRKSVTWKGRKV